MSVLIENLNFSYFNVPILKNINLNIRSGEFILLFGENGAGKSTLLRVIGGKHCVHKYNKFSILNKKIPCDQSDGLAYLGNPWKRVISFAGNTDYTIDLPAGKMMHSWQKEFKKRRDELVEVLEIDLNWKMNKVSDGQRKRVQIMLALLKPFKLLLIDEYTNELDIVVRYKFFKYLQKEVQERGASIIYATHIFDMVDEFCTDVLFIANGELQYKQNLKTFIGNFKLSTKIRNEILNNKTIMNNSVINKSLFGPQGGWSSGRCQNIN